MLTVSPGYTIYNDIDNDTTRSVISYSLPIEYAQSGYGGLIKSSISRYRDSPRSPDKVKKVLKR